MRRRGPPNHRYCSSQVLSGTAATGGGSGGGGAVPRGRVPITGGRHVSGTAPAPAPAPAPAAVGTWRDGVTGRGRSELRRLLAAVISCDCYATARLSLPVLVAALRTQMCRQIFL